MALDFSRIRPLNGRVLIEKIGEFGVRRSVLWRPADAKETVWEGKALAVPAGSDVAVGDLVLYGKYAGRRVLLGNTEYIMMLEDSILGIVTDHSAATDGTPTEQIQAAG